jgi:hypothetical protein
VIVEMRTYTVKPLHTAAFLSLYEQHGLAVQKQHLGHLIGFFVSEVGTLNQVVHLWGFEGLGERERRRKDMEADPRFVAYRKALQDLDVIQHQETRLLRSVSFSPL